MHEGGCQCGNIRYQFDGKALTCYACHCTDCQTATGSAFALSMIVKLENLNIIQGKTALNQFDHNGTDIDRVHCPDCGVALWFAAQAFPHIAALKPGTFDDTSWFSPVAHLWLASAQPWVKLEASTKQYQQQPEMDELIALWQDK